MPLVISWSFHLYSKFDFHSLCVCHRQFIIIITEDLSHLFLCVPVCMCVWVHANGVIFKLKCVRIYVHGLFSVCRWGNFQRVTPNLKLRTILWGSHGCMLITVVGWDWKVLVCIRHGWKSAWFGDLKSLWRSQSLFLWDSPCAVHWKVTS